MNKEKKLSKKCDSLRKQIDDKSDFNRVSEFVKLAQDTIHEMDQIKGIYEFEQQSKLYKDFEDVTTEFAKQKRGFNKWKKKNKIGNEKNDIDTKIVEVNQLQNKLDKGYDYGKVPHFIKLARETIKQMDEFKQNYEKEKSEQLLKLWEKIFSGYQNVDNYAKIKNKKAIAIGTKQDLSKNNENDETVVRIGATCGIFHSTNVINYFNHIENKGNEPIRGFKNVIKYYLSNGGKSECIPKLSGEENDYALYNEDVKSFLNANGINTYVLGAQLKYGKDEKEKLVGQIKDFVKQVLKTHFESNNKSPVAVLGRGHWISFVGYRHNGNTDEVLMVDSLKGKEPQWISLDDKNIVRNIVKPVGNQKIGFEFVVCAKNKQNDSDNFAPDEGGLEFNKGNQQKVLDNVAKF